MSFSKDPETGKPNYVPASKADDVSLVTTEQAQDPLNKAKGVTTPGWVYYTEHTRADGHTARRVDTLVSFRNVPTPVEPEDPETP